MGVVLVVLRGLTFFFEELRSEKRSPHWKLRSALLVIAPGACALASPYGFSLVGYYHRLLANPLLPSFVDEWQASTPSRKTALFFLLAFAAVWLVARYRERLTPFESTALLATMASGLWAIRSIVWFQLAALVILPRALDGALESGRSRAPRRCLMRSLGIGALGAILLGTAVAAAQPSAWYTKAWPQRAARAIERAARDPSARVFADDRHARLPWEVPSLRGRVAYDVRFELFSAEQLRKLASYRSQVGDDWRRAAEGYRLLTFDPQKERSGWRSAGGEPQARVLYTDGAIAVVSRAGSSQRPAVALDRGSAYWATAAGSR